jgi:hypothetical protein
MAEKPEKQAAAAKEAPAANKFSFEQVMGSDKYRAHRDMLAATLDRGRLYTVEELDAAVAAFMERKVA